MSLTDPHTWPPLDELQQHLRWLDLIGVAAFSLSGSLLGIRKRFDLFGVALLGCVTGVGGGAIRDSLMGQTPPLFLRDEAYLWAALLGAAVAFTFGMRLARFERALRIFDSVGLGLFATSGALGAIHLGLGPLGVLFASMLSGVGGGIVRDLISGQVPEVLYRHDQLYATAALAGGLVVLLLHTHMPPLYTQVLGSMVVIALRVSSRRGWIKVPVRHIPDEPTP